MTYIYFVRQRNGKRIRTVCDTSIVRFVYIPSKKTSVAAEGEPHVGWAECRESSITNLARGLLLFDPDEAVRKIQVTTHTY